MPQKQRVIVTGAPGTGKSTVLNLLELKGYLVIPEMARQLIAEEQALDSDRVPWKDHASFGIELFDRQVNQFDLARDGITFYDRGILDNLAYLRRDGLQNSELEEASRAYPYHPEIFLMPPWEDIYDTDEVRWEGLDLMLDIDRALREMYSEMGYTVLEVPKLSPPERVNYILEHLGLDG